MKKLIILTVAIAAITTLSLSAADPAAPAAPKKAKPPIPAELLAKYDKNKDGKVDKADNLTKEEMAAYKAELKKSRAAAPAAPAK